MGPFAKLIAFLSKTPTANRRRPLPFCKRPCGQTLGPRLAELMDYAFLQPLWKALEEHVGGKRKRKEEEEEEEEAS